MTVSVVDRETGRRWVERELSDPEYSATDLTPLERIGQWFDGLWDALFQGALRANSPWMLILVVLVLAAIVAIIVWRVRRAGLKRARIPLRDIGAVVVDPDPARWRAEARTAAEAGDYRTAVIDQARAIFAVLARAHVVSPDTALTAVEIGRLASSNLPEFAHRLDRVAPIFDLVAFGADEYRYELSEVYAEFLALDRDLSALPSRRGSAGTPTGSIGSAIDEATALP